MQGRVVRGREQGKVLKGGGVCSLGAKINRMGSVGSTCMRFVVAFYAMQSERAGQGRDQGAQCACVTRKSQEMRWGEGDTAWLLLVGTGVWPLNQTPVLCHSVFFFLICALPPSFGTVMLLIHALIFAPAFNLVLLLCQHWALFQIQGLSYSFIPDLCLLTSASDYCLLTAVFLTAIFYCAALPAMGAE